MRRLVLLSVSVCLWLAWNVPGKAQEDTTRALIEKAIKAHGGAEKLSAAKATQVRGKGKAEVMGMTLSFTIDVQSQLPDKVKSAIDLEVNNMNIQVIQVFNGKKGWTNAAGKTVEMDAKEVQEVRGIMQVEMATGLVPLRDKSYKLSPLGEFKVEGKDALGVQVTKQGTRDLNLYFDKTSHLLVKAEYRALDPVTKQEVQQEKLFFDYKDVMGMKSPGKMVINNDGKRFLEMEVSDVTILDRIDDSVFAKP